MSLAVVGYSNDFARNWYKLNKVNGMSLSSIAKPTADGWNEFYLLMNAENSADDAYRIKANLAPRTVFHKESAWHIDSFPCSTTAILYMNTNNGWTEFKKRGRVKSVANRAVIFDSNLEHRGVTCTDANRRVLINFNYEV